MDKTQTEQLYALLEQWTRAEIVARFGQLYNPGDIDYARIQIEKEDEIRRLLFGTDDLIILGIKWGILKNAEEQAIETKKQTKEAKILEFKRLQKELAELT